MKMFCMSRDGVTKWLASNPLISVAAVSITDPSEPIVHFPGCVPVVRVSFHDFDIWRHPETAELKCFGGEQTIAGASMQPSHANLISAFVHSCRAKDTKVLLIHCEAGVSRSVSTAKAIADHFRLGRDSITFTDVEAKDQEYCQNSKPINRHVHRLVRIALLEIVK